MRNSTSSCVYDYPTTLLCDLFPLVPAQEVAQRRGQQYVEKRTGSIEPEPELPWAEQKRLIEEAARAAEEAEEAAKQANVPK